MKKPLTITDQVRRAILDAKARGLSRYAIARLIGCSEGNLGDLVGGEVGIRSNLLDKLAPVLGLRLVVDVDVQRRQAKRLRSRKARTKREANRG